MTTAIETKPIDCPHCKGKIEVEIERRPAAKVHIEKLEDPTMPVSELETFVEKAIAKREAAKVETIPKEKEKSPKIPSYVKKYKCKSCGKLHENKEFEGLPKGRCDTCGSILTNRSKGKCPYCKDGEIEALEESDLEEMGLYLEDEEENEHEHE